MGMGGSTGPAIAGPLFQFLIIILLFIYKRLCSYRNVLSQILRLFLTTPINSASAFLLY